MSMDEMRELKIETVRLRMIAANCDLLSADLTGADALCAPFCVARPVDWPPAGSEYDEAAVRFFLKMLSDGGERAIGWYSWYAVLRATKDQAAQLVGNGGFFGPPDNHGSVEIRYSVCQEWRRKGIATEMVDALVSYAWTKDAVRRVIARASAGNLASIGVLRRNGFRETGGDESEKMKFERLRGHPD
jgi:RimJ/RimL family protein N-acetyltransferase